MTTASRFTVVLPSRALEEELKKLFQLKDNGTVGNVLDPAEEEKRRIASIFERINEARAQVQVRASLPLNVLPIYFHI